MVTSLSNHAEFFVFAALCVAAFGAQGWWLCQARSARLSESEQRYLGLIESLPAALYTCDVEGRVTLFNQAAAGLWGREPALGKDLWCGSWRIFDPSGLPVALEDCPMAVAMRTGQPVRGREIVIERPDGTRAHVLPYPDLLRDAAGTVIGAINMLVDLTDRRQAEEQLAVANRRLLDVSRQAGMAEVATSVLHNVGNVLNSANVSVELATSKIRQLKCASLGKAAVLLREQSGDLSAFFANAQGALFPGFLSRLSEHFAAQQAAVLGELASLRANIDHINEIVTMQQSYASCGGLVETIKVAELIEDGLRMNAESLAKHAVTVTREFTAVPDVSVDKHKLLQILVNLIRNGMQSCEEAAAPEKRLTVRVANGNGSVKISVADNGLGIPPENLARIFNHGFTTKKTGHGFGLHSGALAAKEMGGALRVESAGRGLGATFTVELPLHLNAHNAEPQTQKNNAE